jgi:hypothetical protein
MLSLQFPEVSEIHSCRSRLRSFNTSPTPYQIMVQQRQPDDKMDERLTPEVTGLNKVTNIYIGDSSL